MAKRLELSQVRTRELLRQVGMDNRAARLSRMRLPLFA